VLAVNISIRTIGTIVIKRIVGDATWFGVCCALQCPPIRALPSVRTVPTARHDRLASRMRFRRTAQPTAQPAASCNAHRSCVRDRRALEERCRSADRVQHSTLRLQAALVQRSRHRNEKSARPTPLPCKAKGGALLRWSIHTTCHACVWSWPRIRKRTWRVRAYRRACARTCVRALSRACCMSAATNTLIRIVRWRWYQYHYQ
jgi:hypothetical protein